MIVGLDRKFHSPGVSLVSSVLVYYFEETANYREWLLDSRYTQVSSPVCHLYLFFFFATSSTQTAKLVMLASHFLFDSFEILYSVHFIFSGTIFQRARLFSISAPKSDVIVQEQCFTPRISYQQRRQSLPRRGFFGSNLAWLEFGSSDAAGSSNASTADFNQAPL